MLSNLHFSGEKSISFDENAYVYSIVTPEIEGNKRVPSIFAASGSNREIHIYDIETFQGISKLNNSDGQITDISFINSNFNNENMLLSSYSSGDICVWDLRTCNPVIHINYKLSILTAKMNKSGMIVGGTEFVDEEAFLNIWDIRNHHDIVASFSDSFGDDVSLAKFNPSNDYCLSTSSLDGLCCIFDISKHDEDESLCNVFNIQNPISNFNYFGPSWEYLWLSTCIEGFSSWNTSEGASLFSYDDVRDSYIDYIIDLVYDKNQQRLFMVSGNHEGNIVLSHVNMDGFAHYSFLNGGHTSTVRSVLWDFENKFIISGGEDGALTLWKNI